MVDKVENYIINYIERCTDKDLERYFIELYLMKNNSIGNPIEIKKFIDHIKNSLGVSYISLYRISEAILF